MVPISRRGCEVMAELESLELEHDLVVPEPHDASIENISIEKLLLEISHRPRSGISIGREIFCLLFQSICSTMPIMVVGMRSNA